MYFEAFVLYLNILFYTSSTSLHFGNIVMFCIVIIHLIKKDVLLWMKLHNSVSCYTSISYNMKMLRTYT